ncbi:hypothetical protein Scep_009640 [Stephania cephalantha]|uniref:Uncharacterized protein n=1 Tax=Stephania cephalantha TaxID=152367 RepID=A0AAP0PEI7_9MAGN
MMKKPLFYEEHAQTVEVDLLGEPILVDLGISLLEERTRIAERKKKRQTTSQKKRRQEDGIKTSDSAVGCDIIATELFYKACTSYDRTQASILSQESLDSYLNLASAQEECEKLKEQNTMLRDTREMEIRKDTLAYKASPNYRAELKDFMIENGDFFIINGWNKCVTHLRHKYHITNDEAKDLDSLDVKEDVGTSTTIQGEDQLFFVDQLTPSGF